MADQSVQSKKVARLRFTGMEDARLTDRVRVLQEYLFPVEYSQNFYKSLFNQWHKMNHLAYFNDVLIGIVACRLERAESAPGTPTTELLTNDGAGGKVRAYIMTLGVLKAYRRLGIASELLELALNQLRAQAAANPKLELVEVALHVQTSNTDGLAFYAKNGFEIGPVVKGYYKQLDVKDAHLVTKKL